MGRITENFTLEEFTHSDTAEERGIDNTPSPLQEDNIIALAENIMQPIRDHFGRSVRITSGLRVPMLNEAVGGARTSQHTKGEAADFYVEGVDLEEVFDWIIENLEYDQVIYEFARWIHVSWSNDTQNRSEALIAEKINGKTNYRRA